MILSSERAEALFTNDELKHQNGERVMRKLKTVIYIIIMRWKKLHFFKVQNTRTATFIASPSIASTTFQAWMASRSQEVWRTDDADDIIFL